MSKQKWFLVLIVMSLMALIGSAAGCAAAPTGPAVKPNINSFTGLSPLGLDKVPLLCYDCSIREVEK
ncbi:MAG: hypothetical protein FJ023_09570 [Chloroflexi bacterium]|nr:hypothetical protein [Chloroflexota bacterium]